METIHIPLTGDDQDRQIIDTYGVYVVKGWELAARIYARCQPQRRRLNRDYNRSSQKISFAALSRITGRHADVISLHWHHWEDARLAGEVPAVNPGDTVTLPSTDYPRPEQAAQTVAVSGSAPPEDVAAAIDKVLAKRPEVKAQIIEEFVQEASRDTKLFARISQRWLEKHPVPAEPPIPTMAMNSLGFGNTVYHVVQGQQHLLPPLLDYLRLLIERQDPEVSTFADDEVATLEKGKDLIDEYIGRIRQSIYDATFDRLVGRS